MGVKRIGWLILILLLSLLAALALYRPDQVASQKTASGTAFDGLAHRVPADVVQAFFLNLKPGGEAGRHWARIRRQLEANPAAQEGLDGLFHEFRIGEYGLEEFVTGPAVSGYESRTRTGFVVVQIGDEEATRDALLVHFEDVTWEQEEHEEKILYYGRILDSWRQREWLAWTLHDGHLFLSHSHAFAPEGDQDHQGPLVQLRALVSLAQEDSLAALPAWRALRDRLPQAPMGLIFLNLTEQARRNPSTPDDTSLGAALSRQPGAVAWAAVPEKSGMRVEIAGAIELQPDAPPELRALFNMPGVNPAAWPGLPADTAIALIGHDASVLWPWLNEISDLDAKLPLSETVGLDLGVDLAGAGGPLSGPFGLAITPPLPSQPVIHGLPAGQLLILAPGVSEAQAAGVRAAMEGRGAVFGPTEVEGVALQTQMGTELSGYAISYGFDDGSLLFGSSPAVIGRSVVARREDAGLVTTEIFQALSTALPDAPSLVFYLDSELMTGLARANMPEAQYQKSPEYLALETFEAIGLGLRLAPDGLIDGTLYFFVPE